MFERHAVDPRLRACTLFGHVTNSGRDHIAATVNTLVLAYAGAALPLLLLFVRGDEGWLRVINREVVADEIVRALVGSIGLIAAVPITTALACLLAVRMPAGARAEGEPPTRIGTRAAPGQHHYALLDARLRLSINRPSPGGNDSVSGRGRRCR